MDKVAKCVRWNVALIQLISSSLVGGHTHVFNMASHAKLASGGCAEGMGEYLIGYLIESVRARQVCVKESCALKLMSTKDARAGLVIYPFP